MTVETDAIGAELERIVASRAFAASHQMVRLLRFCVMESRRGELGNLKESIIGVRVFGRESGYDPKVDPIVRVNARRLREKLEAFYASAESSGLVIRIPKGGYVARFDDTPPARVGPSLVFPETLAAKAEPKRARWRIWAAALVAGATLALAAAARLSKEEDIPAAEPVLNLPGSVHMPNWSPDGATLAFTWKSGDERPARVFLLKAGSATPDELTRSREGESNPVWSPDGKWIALLRKDRNAAYSIVLVEVASRQERVLRTAAAKSMNKLFLPALDWSPDGKWLVSSAQTSPQAVEPSRLILIAVADGRDYVLTDPPNASTGDLEARFSPDGKRIAFRRGGRGDLFVTTLEGTSAASPRQLTRLSRGIQGIAWSSDGTSIYFGSPDDGRNGGIWNIPVVGGQAVRVTPPGMPAIAPAVNRRSKVLTFAQPLLERNLWLHDEWRAREPEILAPSAAFTFSPAFSPDGQQVAFVSSRSGSMEIWVAPLHGGQPRRITHHNDNGMILWPSWSPDGSAIAYYRRKDGRHFAMAASPVTGQTSILREGDSYALAPQYSADGKYLYFVSDYGRRFRIWRQPVNSAAEAEPVIPDNINFFRLSKDRAFLYFIRPAGSTRELVRVRLSTKKQENAWTVPSSLDAFDSWDVSDSQLFYLDEEPAGSRMMVYARNLDSGAIEVLGPGGEPSDDWHTGISVAPGGRAVIATHAERDETRLMALGKPVH